MQLHIKLYIYIKIKLEADILYPFVLDVKGEGNHLCGTISYSTFIVNRKVGDSSPTYMDNQKKLLFNYVSQIYTIYDKISCNPNPSLQYIKLLYHKTDPQYGVNPRIYPY